MLSLTPSISLHVAKMWNLITVRGNVPLIGVHRILSAFIDHIHFRLSVALKSHNEGRSCWL